MTKIDKRKNYYMIIDTETSNSLQQPLVYDVGGCIIDKKGTVYEKFSFIVYDIFFLEKDLMKTAYYAKKIPQYYEKLKNNQCEIRNFLTIKKYINQLYKKYNVTAIMAHNARFDYLSLQTTLRYITKSKYRYFFPYGAEIWDTLKMAHDTIGKQKTYIQFCKYYGYMTKHKAPRPKLTAEVLYRYITSNQGFNEKHMGLDDVLIEKVIFTKCIAQHKKMRKGLWAS